MMLLKNELSAVGSILNPIAKKFNSYASTPGMKVLMESYRLVKDATTILHNIWRWSFDP